MPNHIQNRLQFTGSTKEVKKLFTAISGTDGEGGKMKIDFNKIKPQPENIFNGNLGEPEREMCKRENRPNWYDWNTENWGTKWNAYAQNDTRDEIDTIYFQTAWSAPVELIRLLSTQFPTVQIKMEYADEDSGSNTGELVFKNGEAIEEYYPESQSKDGYELYFELHGGRECYELVDGNYIYKEEA